MATDVEQRLREAIRAILGADSGLQTLCGRSTEIVKPLGDIGTVSLPVLGYALITMDEIGGTGDNRSALVQFSAFVEGTGAEATANAMIERVELGLTQPLLAAAGLDAAVLRRRRYHGPLDREGSRATARSDCDAEIWITK